MGYIGIFIIIYANCNIPQAIFYLPKGTIILTLDPKIMKPDLALDKAFSVQALSLLAASTATCSTASVGWGLNVAMSKHDMRTRTLGILRD